VAEPGGLLAQPPGWVEQGGLTVSVDAGTWLLGAGTIAVGSALSLGVEAVRRRWTKADSAEAFARSREAEQRGRIEGRSEEAAQKLVEVFEALRSQGAMERRAPNRLVVPAAYLGTLRRNAVYIADPDVRARVETAVGVLENAWEVAGLLREQPIVVVWRTAIECRDSLGAMLRGEPIPVATDLARFSKGLDDYWDWVESNLADEEGATAPAAPPPTPDSP
jgi:hypothetical protein